MLIGLILLLLKSHIQQIKTSALANTINFYYFSNYSSLHQSNFSKRNKCTIYGVFYLRMIRSVLINIQLIKKLYFQCLNKSSQCLLTYVAWWGNDKWARVWYCIRYASPVCWLCKYVVNRKGRTKSGGHFWCWTHRNTNFQLKHELQVLDLLNKLFAAEFLN